ncbi:Holliday junction branch migration protein RuvA, partial [Dysosmobacter welbionis]
MAHLPCSNALGTSFLLILPLVRKIASVLFHPAADSCLPAEDGNAILPGLQYPNIPELLLRHRQGVPVQNHQIRLLPRRQGALVRLLKILVCSVDRHRLQGRPDVHPLFPAQDAALPGHPVHGTPHRLQHIGPDHRRILMECEGDPLLRRRACGTDGLRPAGSQIFQMDIPPVVHVGHEERGDHPQPPHLRQLVPAQQLGVDH